MKPAPKAEPNAETPEDVEIELSDVGNRIRQGLESISRVFAEVRKGIERAWPAGQLEALAHSLQEPGHSIREYILREGWRAMKHEHHRGIAAGRAGSQARERRAKRFGWKAAALALDREMSRRKTRTRRAVDIAETLAKRGFSIGWRTVYDVLPARRPRRSR